MDASDLTDHISRRFNKDIEDLRNNVLTMGGLVESQLSLAIKAIVSGDSELGLKVAHDDYKVNNLEVNIDEECGRILATRGPTAGDLRLIVAIIKTITDLERIATKPKRSAFSLRSWRPWTGRLTPIVNSRPWVSTLRTWCGMR